MVAADAPAREFDWATGDLTQELHILQRFYEKNYDIDTQPATAGVGSQGVNLLYGRRGPQQIGLARGRCVSHGDAGTHGAGKR